MDEDLFMYILECLIQIKLHFTVATTLNKQKEQKFNFSIFSEKNRKNALFPSNIIF